MTTVIGDQTQVITTLSSPAQPLCILVPSLISLPYQNGLLAECLNPEGTIDYSRSASVLYEMEHNLDAFACVNQHRAGFHRERGKGFFHCDDLHLDWKFAGLACPYNGWQMVVTVPEVTPAMEEWAHLHHWTPR